MVLWIAVNYFYIPLLWWNTYYVESHQHEVPWGIKLTTSKIQLVPICMGNTSQAFLCQIREQTFCWILPRKKYLMLVSCNFILTKVEIFPKWNFGRKLCLLCAVLQNQIEKTLIFYLGLTKGSWHHKSHSRSRRFWRSLHLWHYMWHNSTLTSVKSAFNLFSVENCNTHE